MNDKLRERIYRYNREKAADKEKGNDLMILLGALPPGQVKQLLKDKTCAAILAKHGVTAGE